MFLYRWFLRYRPIENLKRSVTSKKTGTRANEVTTIARCTLSSLDNNVLLIRDSYCLSCGHTGLTDE